MCITGTGHCFKTAFWYEPYSKQHKNRYLLTNEFKLCKGRNFIFRSDPDSVYSLMDDPIHLQSNLDEIRLNVWVPYQIQ
jgi:hypothetical protein